MSEEIEQQFRLLRLEIQRLKTRVAALEVAKDNAMKGLEAEMAKLRPLDNRTPAPFESIPPRWPSPYEYAPSPAPTWWPFTGPTCIDTTAAHEAPPSDPSPACPSPTSGAGEGT